VGLALCAASVALVVRELGVPFTAFDMLPACALALVSNPFRQQVNQGQLNFVLLMLLTLAWAADRRGRPVSPGAAVGAAAAIKLFPVFIALYFLGRRDWRALGGVALGGGVLMGIAAIALGVDTIGTYFRAVVPQANEWRSAWINASLPGLWSKLLD